MVLQKKKRKKREKRSFCRIFQKMPHQQIKIKSVKANLRIRNFQDKNEVEMKKFGKMSLIFELTASKLGYMEIFMKV